MTPEQSLAALQETLPVIPAPRAIYKPCLIDGKHLHVSGHVPLRADGIYPIRLKTVFPQACHIILRADAAPVHPQVQIDVHRVIRIFGMVNATPDFERHPHVINGCSELFAQVWGDDHGVGTRSAVGMGSLPDRVPVEIEAIFELHGEEEA
ncbi:MAG: RidA family protein [Chitinophagaceae bacterium]|nr:RidA family protein [Chitinophagaceae bacterium]